jgi:hypothetical protein
MAVGFEERFEPPDDDQGLLPLEAGPRVDRPQVCSPVTRIEDHLPLASGLLRFDPGRESRRNDEACYEDPSQQRCPYPEKIHPCQPLPFRNGAEGPPRATRRLAT